MNLVLHIELFIHQNSISNTHKKYGKNVNLAFKILKVLNDDTIYMTKFMKIFYKICIYTNDTYNIKYYN